jgi:hypothetical protein
VVNQDIHLLGSLFLSSGSIELLVKTLIPAITVFIGEI